MPGREIPLVTGEVYHVINRGIATQPVFLNKRHYRRAMEAIFYYQNRQVPFGFAQFSKLSGERREKLLEELRKKKEFLVEIITFCLMPTHIHLLLKQVYDNGISIFMSQFANSYTRYFNVGAERIGPLFQGKFKGVRIETDEQLFHVSRYIHLNPYSSYVVKTLESLKTYPYSSLPEYLTPEKSNYFQKELVLAQFKSPTDYKKFVFDQANYQRRLEEIKHLILEK